jgi:hypothetical protein
MIKIWKWIRNNPNRAMFLVPIILVAAISISHVVTWYDMANPINWAIYLSIAIEIAAMTALIAVDSRIKGGIWFMFGLVTFIQVLGNVFYCYKEIDSNGELFKAWVELTSPVWELVGTEVTDVISLKRWLAFLEGGLLPIISLTSLHFFITYKKENENPNNNDKEEYFKNRNKEIEKIVDNKIDLEKKSYIPHNPPINNPIIKQNVPTKELIDRVKESQEKLKENVEVVLPIPEDVEIEKDDDFEDQPPFNSDNEELAKIIIEEVLEDSIKEEITPIIELPINQQISPKDLHKMDEEIQESKKEPIKVNRKNISGDKKRID